MAPKKDSKPAKGNSKSKSKGSGGKADKDEGGSSKLKAATAINTRHILVCTLPPLSASRNPTND